MQFTEITPCDEKSDEITHTQWAREDEKMKKIT